MAKALIGSTGFVGGTLLRQTQFDDCYHSTDIDTIRGRHFELLAISGAPAAKWLANREPEKDRQSIERLTDNLTHVTADRTVLISTVDVFPRPVEVDEQTPIDPAESAPYGKHRRLLELFVADRFPGALTLRLPALFGQGLKKNALFDLLHDNDVSKLVAESAFQFYDMEHLWRDIGRALDAGLTLLNIATEPIAMGEIAQRVFGRRLVSPAGATPARYDFRSRYDRLWGGSGGYLYSAGQVLEGIAAFVARQGGCGDA